MPEYLAPGVYVEEVSFRSKSIEGVATSTTGFAGTCTYGPVNYDGGPKVDPRLVTSFAEFERVFGGLQRLKDGRTDGTNYTAHSAKAFFDNGGQRLYISRVFAAASGSDGIARGQIRSKECFRARWPGSAGNVTIDISPIRSKNLSKGKVRGAVIEIWDRSKPDVLAPKIRPLSKDSLVMVDADEQGNLGVYQGQTFVPFEEFTKRAVKENWFASPAAPSRPTADVPARPAGDAPAKPAGDAPAKTAGDAPAKTAGDAPAPAKTAGDAPAPARPVAEAAVKGDRYALFVVELRVRVAFSSDRVDVHDELSTFADHKRAIGRVLDLDRPEDDTAIICYTGRKADKAIDTISLLVELTGDGDDGALRTRLAGGSDGRPLQASDLEGKGASPDDAKIPATGLSALADIDDIAIIAMPDAGGLDEAQCAAAAGMLITQAELLRYRFAIIDAPPTLPLDKIRKFRGQFDSKYAALYHPWIQILDPLDRSSPPALLTLPPSGFVAGIYARSDVQRGVHKAPANEVVRGLSRLEININKGRQDVLNPEGINALRFFEGRGSRVWGARTLSSDPEWKYVNVRRMFIYLEHSIDKGTQWAVFEPNNERLWRNIRNTVEDFLLVMWSDGALMGSKPEEAFFVRCDRTTMLQNDLDNGRLICQIGVSPVKPAEFVIFRIGQWTAGNGA